MLKSFARRISRRVGNVLKLLSQDEIDDAILDKEKNLYKRQIIREARAIGYFDADVYSGSDLAEAIAKIGRLAYAGGPPATKCAGTYLPDLAKLLNREDIRTDLKIAIVKTVSIITVGHLEHQDRCESLGLLQQVLDVIQDRETPECLLLWSTYCLHNMIVGNIPCMQLTANNSSMKFVLKNISELDWNAFQSNYATDVLKMTGLESLEDASQLKSSGELEKAAGEVENKPDLNPT